MRDDMSFGELLDEIEMAYQVEYADNERLRQEIESLRKENVRLETGQISQIPCCECGGEVVEYSIPNDIWNIVMRPDGKETDKEYLCLGCWHEALRRTLEELINQTGGRQL